MRRSDGVKHPTYTRYRNNCVDLSARNRNIANKTPAPQREAGANTRPVGRPSGRHVGLLCPEGRSPTYKGCRNNCVDLSARNRNIANKTPAPQREAGANTRPVGRPSGRHVGLLCPECESPTYKGCRNNCVDLSARNRNIANKTPAPQREAGANTRPVGRPSGRHVGLLCPECESPTYKGCRNNCVDLSARNRNIANKTPAPPERGRVKYTTSRSAFRPTPTRRALVPGG